MEAGELDQETVIKVAKERGKEIKILQRKLSKIEERYVQKHNEYTDLQNDRDGLVNFVQLVLNEEFQPELGQCNFEELEQKWAKMQKDQRSTIQDINMQASEQLQKQNQKLKKLETELRVKNKLCSELKDIEAEFTKAEAERFQLREQNEIYETELEATKMEMARHRASHEEIAKQKASALLSVFSDKKPTVKGDESSTEQLDAANETIKKLKKEISNLKSQTKPIDVESIKELARADSVAELDQVKEKLENTETKAAELEKMLVSVREEFQEHRKKAQRMMMEKEMNLEKLKQRNSVEERPMADGPEEDVNELKLRLSEFERSRSLESVNMEYLKNCTLKYMECVESGNYKEAQTLSVVIETVLQFSSEEVQIVEKAREGNGYLAALWQTDKSPGSGLSHNTIHTVSGRKRANLPVDN